MWKKNKVVIIILMLAVIGAIFYMCNTGKSCGCLGSNVASSSAPNSYYTIILNSHTYYAGGIHIDNSAITLTDPYIIVNKVWQVSTKPTVLMLNPGDSLTFTRNQ
jgi:hypothetical protein